MGYMAKWGPKGFLVSPTKVVPFDNFSTSMTLKSDSENDTSGTPPTNTRGRELQQMTFETTYLRAAGVDPRGQIDEWEAQLGKAYPLYIGNKRFGPPKMMLTGVAVSDAILTASGEFLSVKIALTMQEYSEGKTSVLASTKASAKKSGKNTSSASKASATYAATVAEKRKAMNATASASDRANKKTSGGSAGKGMML